MRKENNKRQKNNPHHRHHQRIGRAFRDSIETVKKHLKTDVAVKKEVAETTEVLKLFTHPLRQDLLAIVYKTPGRTLSELADAVGKSAPTVRWHLEKLIELGLVSSQPMGSRTIYLPTGLTIDSKLIRCIACDELNCKLLSYLKAKGYKGATLKNIKNQFNIKSRQALTVRLEQLIELGLLTVVKEGVWRRYLVVEPIYYELLRPDLKRSKAIARHIIEVLIADGVEPRIRRVTDEELRLTVLTQTNDDYEFRDITLNLHPFKLLLETHRAIYK